jgi:hypothetical protein
LLPPLDVDRLPTRSPPPPPRSIVPADAPRPPPPAPPRSIDPADAPLPPPPAPPRSIDPADAPLLLAPALFPPRDESPRAVPPYWLAVARLLYGAPPRCCGLCCQFEFPPLTLFPPEMLFALLLLLTKLLLLLMVMLLLPPPCQPQL